MSGSFDSWKFPMTKLCFLIHNNLHNFVESFNGNILNFYKKGPFIKQASKASRKEIHCQLCDLFSTSHRNTFFKFSRFSHITHYIDKIQAMKWRLSCEHAYCIVKIDTICVWKWQATMPLHSISATVIIICIFKHISSFTHFFLSSTAVSRFISDVWHVYACCEHGFTSNTLFIKVLSKVFILKIK